MGTLDKIQTIPLPPFLSCADKLREGENGRLPQ